MNMPNLIVKIKKAFQAFIDWLTHILKRWIKPKPPAQFKPKQNLSNVNKAVLNQVLCCFLPVADINILKRTNTYLSKNTELTERHKTIVKNIPEIQKLYPTELIEAFGLENIAALPELSDLVVCNRAIRYYPRRDTEVYYLYQPIKASHLQGYKAVRGTSLQDDPLTFDSFRIGYVSYLYNGEVITICRQPRYLFQNNWVSVRGETQESSVIEDWPALGREFKQSDLNTSKSLALHR
jgi:hypothetical protein